jgi:ribonucleoside-diphosphate reductase alpha chain
MNATRISDDIGEHRTFTHPARPVAVSGVTYGIASPDGTVNVTVNSDAGGPCEVFINVGRAGSDIAALAEAIGRLVSLALRLPCPVRQVERLRHVATQLRGIGGSRSVGFGKKRVLSMPDAVAKALLIHMGEETNHAWSRR